MTFQDIFTVTTAIISSMFEGHDTLSNALELDDDRALAHAIQVLAKGQHLDPDVIYDLSNILFQHDSFRFWDGGGKWEPVFDRQDNVIVPEERLREMYEKQLEGNARYAERRKAQGR